jgi:Protein kinase domain
MLVGDMLLGRYRIERILGTGGMGMVVAATDGRTHQPVALKLLVPERSGDQTAIARMFREAEAAAQLVGRHSGRIFDVARLESGAPILVMEHLDGEDLARYASRVGVVAESLAVAMILDACEGLAEAHARGLVHRDIKPSNLFLARELDGTEIVKVIDFGVVKNQLDTKSLTTTMSMVGSVSYMAPEQLRKQAIDERVDVWALGVVLYELIAGRRPFPAETITDASIRIAIENPDPLPATVGTHVANAIARCLEKDPNARLQSVAELADALAPGTDRAVRIAKTLGRTRTPVLLPRGAVPRSRAVRARAFLENNGPLVGFGVVLWSLVLLLGSFAVDDRLNELKIGTKRTGYVSSFNWTLVHTVLSPAVLLVLSLVWRATTATVATMGDVAVRIWDHKTRNIFLLGIAMSLVWGVGYTAIEWSYVTTGRCNRGTFLGWPNQLCEVAGDAPLTLLFMVLAAIAQTMMLSIGWMFLSTVLWLSEMFFGPSMRRHDDATYLRIGHVFGIATWGWAALFAAMYLARFWGVHLRTPNTDGVLATALAGSLFAIDAHTQSDWGSIVAAGISSIGATVPLFLLRLRTTTRFMELVTSRGFVVILSGAGFTSMVFPRLGLFLLPSLAIIALVVPSARRVLVDARSATRPPPDR